MLTVGLYADRESSRHLFDRPHAVFPVKGSRRERDEFKFQCSEFEQRNCTIIFTHNLHF